jgi:hypothetical protein
MPAVLPDERKDPETAYGECPVQMLDRATPAAPSLGHVHYPDQEARMTHQPPSSRQLNYLRSLAYRTGQTFTWPQNKAQASREIQRLRRTRPSTAIERLDIQSEQAARQANCDVPVDLSEITGHGSTATWSNRP